MPGAFRIDTYKEDLGRIAHDIFETMLGIEVQPVRAGVVAGPGPADRRGVPGRSLERSGAARMRSPPGLPFHQPAYVGAPAGGSRTTTSATPSANWRTWSAAT